MISGSSSPVQNPAGTSPAAGTASDSSNFRDVNPGDRRSAELQPRDAVMSTPFLVRQDIASLASTSHAMHRELALHGPNGLQKAVFAAEEEVLAILRQRAAAREKGDSDQQYDEPLKNAQAKVTAAKERLALVAFARNVMAQAHLQLIEDFWERPDRRAAAVGLTLGRIGQIGKAKTVLQWAIARHPAGTAIGDQCRQRMIELDMPAQAVEKDAEVSIRASLNEALSDLRSHPGHPYYEFPALLRALMSSTSADAAQWQIFKECLDMTPAEYSALPFPISIIFPLAERVRLAAKATLQSKLDEVQANFKADSVGWADRAGLWLGRLGRFDEAREVLRWGIDCGDEEAARACRLQLQELGETPVLDAATPDAGELMRMQQSLDSVHALLGFADMNPDLIFDDVAVVGRTLQRNTPSWLAFRKFLDMSPQELAGLQFMQINLSAVD